MVGSSVGTMRINGTTLNENTLIPTIQGFLNDLTTDKLKELQYMDITAEAIQNMLTEKMPGMTLPNIDAAVVTQVKGFIEDILQKRAVNGGRKRKRRRTKRKRSKRSKRKYSAIV